MYNLFFLFKNILIFSNFYAKNSIRISNLGYIFSRSQYPINIISYAVIKLGTEFYQKFLKNLGWGPKIIIYRFLRYITRKQYKDIKKICIFIIIYLILNIFKINFYDNLEIW